MNLVGGMLRALIQGAGLTQLEFADRCGMSRLTVNQLVQNKRTITPRTAYRLARVLQNKGSAEYWMNLQRDADLSRTWEDSRFRKSVLKLKPVKGKA